MNNAGARAAKRPSEVDITKGRTGPVWRQYLRAMLGSPAATGTQHSLADGDSAAGRYLSYQLRHRGLNGANADREHCSVSRPAWRPPFCPPVMRVRLCELMPPGACQAQRTRCWSGSVDRLGSTAMISEDALTGEGRRLSAVANVELGV